MNSVGSDSLSQISKVYNIRGLEKFEFVTKTQLLWILKLIFKHWCSNVFLNAIFVHVYNDKITVKMVDFTVDQFGEQTL